jgi:TRAP-type C4-dicarboxylate transport system substrate-binding protein
MALRLYKSDLFHQQAAEMEKKLNVKVLPMVGAGGFRMMWNNKRPLKTPADVQGLKIRSTTAPIVIELNKLWGFNPTPIAWTETYTSIKQGVVDGMEVQAIWTYKFNLFEVLKYATETRSTFTNQVQVMNGDLWKAMPPDIQTAFMAAAQEAADIANASDRKLDTEYHEQLKAKGMEIYEPTPAEYKAWRDLGEKVWDGANAKKVDKTLIEALLKMQKT